MCQADQHWEWCRWIHMDQFCDFEWVSSGKDYYIDGLRTLGAKIRTISAKGGTT